MRNIKDFGLYISTKRKEAGLTQDALANIIGITPQAVSKWENGIGYPDVTLFSVLAKALDVSISELFGEEKKTEEVFCVPNSIRGLPKVYESQNYVCYSSKKVEKICEEEGTVYFKDGSIAEIYEKRVTNKGAGEVLIVDVEELRRSNLKKPEEKLLEVFLESFHSIDLVISNGNNVVTIEKGEKPRVEIRGSDAVINAFQISVSDGLLSVLQKNDIVNGQKGSIVIETAFEKGSKMTANMGGNNSLEMEVDWEKAVMQSRGNNTVEGKKTDDLNVRIQGNSCISYDCVKNKGIFDISGNSSVSVKEIGSPKLGISGNSSICFMNVKGDMEVNVSGNSSIEAGGEIDSLKCEVSGNCDFEGKWLTVNWAEVTMLSRGKIHLKHIKKYSVEKIGINTTLVVDKRG